MTDKETPKSTTASSRTPAKGASKKAGAKTPATGSKSTADAGKKPVPKTPVKPTPAKVDPATDETKAASAMKAPAAPVDVSDPVVPVDVPEAPEPVKIPSNVDVVVVGGGPAGAIAAWDLVKKGHSVVLLERDDRIKPCGGAIPPRAMKDFELPDDLLCARITHARMVAPSGASVDMEVEGGVVGMVDRKTFDPWLRARAVKAGAILVRGSFKDISRGPSGKAGVVYHPTGAEDASERRTINAKAIIGADGAASSVAHHVPNEEKIPQVAAYHEVVKMPEGHPTARADFYYQGRISPDFYGWVFPHGDTISVGVGSEIKGYSLKDATRQLREIAGLADAETLRHEGGSLPLKPLARWDNGLDIVLAGDAAGCVASSSGEGIYYALVGGRFAAEAVDAFLKSSNPADLKKARERFMKDYGSVFKFLAQLQRYWYCNDRRRESFVALCADKDIQHMIWEPYLNKNFKYGNPLVMIRIFFQNVLHLLGLVKPKIKPVK